MQLEEQLKQTIIAQLELCDGTETPYVCQCSETEEGRQKIIQLVMKKVTIDHIDIADAIVSIEAEYNSNSIY